MHWLLQKWSLSLPADGVGKLNCELTWFIESWIWWQKSLHFQEVPLISEELFTYTLHLDQFKWPEVKTIQKSVWKSISGFHSVEQVVEKYKNGL